MGKKEEIIEFCKKNGLDTIGFSECKIFHELNPYFERRKKLGLENEFEQQNIDNRLNPFLYMPEGKTIISIAFPYLYSLDFNEKTHFSKYTLGRDYHVVLTEYMNKICKFIEAMGCKALCFVDSNALPERYIACNSGVGFIGKNNALITEKYGSYVFLGEIITDLIIQPDKPLLQKCGNCHICLQACPTNSIVKGKSGMNNNPNICLSYITQKKSLEDHWFEKLNGRLFGCDTCQSICPYNKGIELSKISEFKPYEHMRNIDLEALINMDNKLFKDKYKMTSAGWRGKSILKRNAIINAINIDKSKIETIEKDASPYIRDYYYRLLKFFKL
ncbi:tRNA epoxyqueuosine(34) reductase QueG [Clostridium bowmanii]|uniref:tRNA epoxyqueuosine(34) reductase QueG n=1 Tax=Clostridium bowmanii TaxID=132925 RepID=UPI001C0B94DA|nr:tRNA epoxyqueuosine(34) reductase QueG [Clostridium bowmanii]MBU3188651.1 tRNA epoxyqueuosine(34) reductase QueG [Clostridium bowmanii]MCA1073236.1 tRNA epoxyqueuosine(34) reductase QueG [Clostridium bowmanii]